MKVVLAVIALVLAGVMFLAWDWSDCRLSTAVVGVCAVLLGMVVNELLHWEDENHAEEN